MNSSKEIKILEEKQSKLYQEIENIELEIMSLKNENLPIYYEIVDKYDQFSFREWKFNEIDQYVFYNTLRKSARDEADLEYTGLYKDKETAILNYRKTQLNHVKNAQEYLLKYESNLKKLE